MRIQHNIMAMSAYRNYTNNVSAMKKNLEKLSSGYKINRAGDDAAGLAISEKMRAQITGLETAQKNAKDGISLVQTAEGALTEVHDMLNRMVELATQSANGTYDNTTDRNQMQKEIEQLRSEINRIADSANFNGIQLLDGSMSTAASKVGSVSLVAGSAPEVTIKDVSASKSPLTWASNATASATISQIPATDLTHLHSSSTPGAVGGFTIDLGGMKEQMASGTSTAISIKISNGSASATFTLAASAIASGSLVTGSGIAAAMEDYVLTATKGGTLAFVKATASVGKGKMVFKITAGTGTAGANTVTFAPAAVAKATATASVFIGNTVASSKGTKITSVNDLPDGWDLKHNYSVTAARGTATKAESVQGFQQVGVTKYTNTKTPGKSQFGQAVVALDASKIKDGMIIKVGTGSTAKSYTIRTKGTVADFEASKTIDLTKIVKATTATAGHKADIAQAIANTFAQASLGGIEIGVNSNNNLVVSEKVNADRTSAANADVQKAMSSNTTFQGLVKFQTEVKSNEVKGTATLEINTGKLRNGNTLTVTNNKGDAKTYTITTDKANQNKPGYVYVAASKMSTDLASAVKTALGSVATTFGTGATAAVVGKTVKITFKVGGDQELSDIKARATMTGNKPLVLQIGDTADKFNQLDVDIKDCHTDSLGIADISVADQDKAALAVNKIKDAINIVSDVRGTLGATQNRLDHTINNLSVMTENIQDAESTIRDTDVAAEMMAYTKNNILIQSAQAMLAQANQVPQGVLQLLQ